MKDRLFYVGQKAVINKNGKILILHDPEVDKIDLPGGKIQEGETDFLKSLHREVFEETGLTVKVGRPFATSYFDFVPDAKNPNRAKKIYLVIFECRYLSGEVRLSKEHDWFKWVNQQTYLKYFNNDNILKVLKIYFQLYGENLSITNTDGNDPLLPEVEDYLNKFDFPIASLIQKKFKIGFSRAERILKQLETKRNRDIILR